LNYEESLCVIEKDAVDDLVEAPHFLKFLFWFPHNAFHKFLDVCVRDFFKDKFLIVDNLINLSLEWHRSQIDITVINRVFLTNDVILVSHDDVKDAVFKAFGWDVLWIEVKKL